MKVHVVTYTHSSGDVTETVGLVSGDLKLSLVKLFGDHFQKELTKLNDELLSIKAKEPNPNSVYRVMDIMNELENINAKNKHLGDLVKQLLDQDVYPIGFGAYYQMEEFTVYQ